MTLRISGKSIDIGETFRSRVEARVAGAVKKYFDGQHVGPCHRVAGRAALPHRLRAASLLRRHAGGDGRRPRRAGELRADGGTDREAAAALQAPAQGPRGPERHRRSRRSPRRGRRRDDADDGLRGPATSDDGRARLPSRRGRRDDGAAAPPFGQRGGDGARPERAPRRRLPPRWHWRVNVVYRRHDGAIGWVDPPAGSGPSEPQPTEFKTRHPNVPFAERRLRPRDIAMHCTDS